MSGGQSAFELEDPLADVAVTLALLSTTTVPLVVVAEPLPYPAQIPLATTPLGCVLGPAMMVPKFETKMREAADVVDALLSAAIPELLPLTLPVLIRVILLDPD